MNIDNPNLALLFSLVADLLAALPTLIKVYRHPQSESRIGYTISAIGFGISVASIQVFNIETTVFVVHVFLLIGALAVLAVRGRGLSNNGRSIPSEHST